MAPEALHVTLAFLGSRPEGDIPAIARLVARIAELEPTRLRPTAVTGVPRRRPRLFAIDLDDAGGRARAVQAAVSAALEGGRFYEPERRRFWPHVTVARVARGERDARPIDEPPPEEWFVADEVALYRSHLGRGPARYEALARSRLGPRS